MGNVSRLDCICIAVALDSLLDVVFHCGGGFLYCYRSASQKGLDIKENHMDCGMTIFDQQTQHTNSGGSGCGCAAITLAAYIMPQLISGEWKRILFVPTGALMSTVSFNEGESVPGIAHGIVLEHC